MKQWIFVTFCLSLLISCNNSTNHKISLDKQEDYKIVEINEQDISTLDYSVALKMKSFVTLSNKIPLGEVQRMITKNNKLFISDSQPKIVCFNIKNGTIEFEISKIGKGPGEFLKITDFLVNEERNLVTVYCQKRKKLINYSSVNGEYINEYFIDFIPMKIANIKGVNIFYNPFKLVPSDKYNYILLFSNTENVNITSKLFVQDSVLSSYMFLYGYEFPFFYNDDGVYFLKRFEDKIYHINDDNISAIFKINLPNPTPTEVWQKKPDRRERSQFNSSQSLTDIYQCGNILYFRFIYQKRFVSVFFDIEKSQVLSCGQMFVRDISLDAPVVAPIRGVFENTFFALAEPFLINFLKENNSDKLPEELLHLNETDNPILIFYETKK